MRCFDWLKNVEVDSVFGVVSQPVKKNQWTKVWIATSHNSGVDSPPVRSLEDLVPGAVVTCEEYNGEPCIRRATTRLVWMWKRKKK